MPVVDFNTEVVNQLPPHRRLPRFIALAKGFVSSLVWLNNIYQAFIGGSDAEPYDAGITYNLEDNAVYNFQVWQSLVDDNTGNTPDTSPDYWMLVLEDVAGATERAKYTCSKIVVEYALNKHFGTTFNQPPALSDIYLTNDAPEYTSFMMSGFDTTPKSYMFPSYSTGILFDIPVYAVASFYKFTVHVPYAFYSGLGATAEQIIRAQVDKYTIIGTSYTITTY